MDDLYYPTAFLAGPQSWTHLRLRLVSTEKMTDIAV